MTFPVGFRWGTTSSATQVEGAAEHSDWYRWEQLGRAPRSGNGNGFSMQFDEDFSILAEHGLDDHILTIDWARLEPIQGHHDNDALEHYTEILRSARSHGVRIWACLHHITLPGWFSDDMGGFTDDRSRSYHWARHVDWIAENFADLVEGFVPIHEPLTYAYNAFLAGTSPPGRTEQKDFFDALRATHLANHEAWRLLSSGDRPVMTVMNLAQVHAGTTSRHPDERQLAQRYADRVDLIIWESWISALRDGVLAIPGHTRHEVAEMAGSFDLIGFTYHDALSVYADRSTGTYPTDLRPGPNGRAPWPEGLGVTIRRLADELPGRPLVVAGCGLTTTSAELDDAARVNHLDECIRLVSGALDDGIDIRGFFHSGAVDGYEWLLGHDAHSGLFDLARNPRNSASVMRRWATMSR